MRNRNSVIPHKERKFIPALKFSWLTPFYDLLLRATMPEMKIKRELVHAANIRAGLHVLDIGCGTGTLATLIKKTEPGATVWGVDADKKVLAIAKSKAMEAHVELTLYLGTAARLPIADSSMDRIVSSLVLHHLTRQEKLGALAEAYRVLRPGGEIHIADWGKPRNALMRIAFLSVRFLDGFETTADSANGTLPELMSKSGFHDVTEGRWYNTIYGTLRMHKGVKPRQAWRFREGS